MAVLLSPGIPTAQAASASFSLYPTTASVDPNGFLSVGVFLSSAGTTINGASATLRFPTDKLEVASIDLADSIINLWVQHPTFSNETGTVTFGGVVFNPGFSGTLGKIVTVRFHAKSGGRAEIGFSSPSVLANDGQGTKLPVDASRKAVLNITGSPSVSALQKSSVDETGVIPAKLIDNSPGSATSVAQALGLSLTIILILLGICNVYWLRKLARRASSKALSEKDTELLRRLKKDVQLAEDVIEKRSDNEDS